MKYRAFATFLIALLLLIAPTLADARGGNGSGNSSSGHGGGGDENRVRVEVRTGQIEPEENRVRVEVRGNEANIDEALNLVNQLQIPEDVNRIRVEARNDQDRVRIELRGPEEVEALPNIEIEGNTFEITGEVIAFTGDTVTIDGQTITINPNLVANFEQEGTIEVGEVIKVEGMVEADGTLLAREIKANGVEVEEAAIGGNSLMALLDQIRTFLQNLI
ncbi:MAG: hypothetical protein HYW45_02150 [Candidatus Daviesbacteria bacterium]|nr:MAG: hypothetical protein HYW45_02150 [Candidatus Daviesbacteria bacterium]